MPGSKSTPIGTPARADSRRLALLACFFLSGAAGLVYEVVWVRVLTLTFGATVLGVSTVLTAFMGGLALGSFLFGRYIDARPDADPLRLYARLEAGIGVYCALTPLLFFLLEKTYVGFAHVAHPGFALLTAVRFVLCFLVLLLPTTLMGGTLPVLSRYLVREFGSLGRGVGGLYSVNTFGAVLGSFGAGFFLVPFLGVRGTICLAAIANLAVAAAASRVASAEAAAGRRGEKRPAPAPDEAAPGRRKGKRQGAGAATNAGGHKQPRPAGAPADGTAAVSFQGAATAGRRAAVSPGALANAAADAAPHACTGAAAGTAERDTRSDAADAAAPGGVPARGTPATAPARLLAGAPAAAPGAASVGAAPAASLGDLPAGAAAALPEGRPAGTPAPAAPAAPLALLLVAYSLSGFAALVYEVAWTRALALVFGTSVYAFATMLTAFLCGLAAGAALCARVVDCWRRPLTAFALLQAGIAAASLVITLALGNLPNYFLSAYKVYASSFWALQFLQFTVCFAVMLPATLLMGATFPVVTRLYAAALRQVGRGIGNAYAANTVGTIIGSFLGGFLLLPFLGAENTIRLAVAVNLLTALALAFAAALREWGKGRVGEWESGRAGEWESGACAPTQPTTPQPAGRGQTASTASPAPDVSHSPIPPLSHSPALPFPHSPILPLAAVLAAFALLTIAWVKLPRWNQKVMSSGVYLYAPVFLAGEEHGLPFGAQVDIKKVRYYADGLFSTVSVVSLPDPSRPGKEHLSLQINGKTDASTGDLSTQILLGHLPMLLHPDPKDALVIGLASGSTLGSVEQYPVDKVDCVEIEPKMLDACRFFNQVNHRPLEDRRLEMILDDGRNHVLLTDRSYDVITSEPSNPWITGVSNLFTREYYAACRRRLKPGGVFCHWIPVYNMSPGDFRTAVNTFAQVFPHTTLWSFPPLMTDVIAIGSLERQQLDAASLARRLAAPRISADLGLIDHRNPWDLLQGFLMDEEDVRDYVAGAGVNVDDRPVIEFATPKTVNSREPSRTMAELLEGRPRTEIPLQAGRLRPEDAPLCLDAPPGATAGLEIQRPVDGEPNAPAAARVAGRVKWQAAGGQAEVAAWRDDGVLQSSVARLAEEAVGGEGGGEVLRGQTSLAGHAAPWRALRETSGRFLSRPQVRFAAAWSCPETGLAYVFTQVAPDTAGPLAELRRLSCLHHPGRSIVAGR